MMVREGAREEEERERERERGGGGGGGGNKKGGKGWKEKIMHINFSL